MRYSDLISTSTDGLLVIRDVYCKDIQYLKSNKIKDTGNEFVLDYINMLEKEIQKINLELIERGIVK